MRRLMFRAILDNRLMMAEAGTDGEGGTGGAGGTPPADKPTDTPPSDTPPADKPTDTPPADKPTDTPPADKPTGEDGITSAIAQKTGDKPTDTPPADKPADTPPAIDAETSKIADEEYSKAMVADEETKKLAADERIELSPELVTGMLPHLKAAGVKPEQAAQLANSLAREQIKAEKKRVAERVESCKRLNAEAMKLYPAESDWKLIGAGVARFFKPGSPMHYTITHSELGSDPEFLALMKYVGERVQADGAAGASSGTGGGKVAVNMAKALGIE